MVEQRKKESRAKTMLGRQGTLEVLVSREKNSKEPKSLVPVVKEISRGSREEAIRSVEVVKQPHNLHF